MPKRSKTGPPYTDIPKEVYVVATHPWGMNRNPRERGQHDFDRIASWAQFSLQQAGLCGGHVPTIEYIYSMGTRDEIILQFAEGTDIIPLLGEHRWANFWKHCPDPNDLRSTCVFLYNWRKNGDPANHNWTENFPSLLSLDNLISKPPYPAPSWTSPPITLTNLVHPIPRPQIPPPMPNFGNNAGQEQQLVTSPPPLAVTPSPAPPQQPNQQECGEQLAEQNSASTNLFVPYQPPSQYPSHAEFLNRSHTRCEEESSSQAVSSPKFIKKLDPYELDEDALNIIRSPNPPEEDTTNVKSETHHISVKAEIPEVKSEEDDARHNISSRLDSGYQPSEALVDAVNSLGRPEQLPPSTRPPSRDPQRPNAGA
ncbi:hypothetical protein JVT61DRAFT_844 [Boletus reticuloceps]|uniref:Uncharacterized protein n=1 Tax=Boletus reticuloceps TaxID=495285 RepID=A0A8I3AE83_9AGAM|nr:hypothetical protein JVT61DRAFT_844 [Boletus reticuloceps]